MRHVVVLSIAVLVLAGLPAGSDASDSWLLEARRDLEVDNGPSWVAVADLNDDGVLDLAVTTAGNGSVAVLLGGADSSFSAPVSYNVGSYPLSVAVADLDDDGVPDLAVVNMYSANVSVLLGHGDGTFAARTNYGVGSYPRSVAIADLDDDGAPDLAVANWGTDNVSVFLGNGNGTFAARTDYSVGSRPTSVAAGDLDGDGAPDLVVANSGGTKVSVLLGNGNGSFASPTDYSTGTGPYSVAIADLDGDAIPDLAVVSSSGDGVSVLLGNGDGSFGYWTRYGVGDQPYSVAVADLNGDGTPDLAVANGESDDVSVLMGNGDGSFDAHIDYSSGDEPFSVAVADLNGDGIPELAVANKSSDTVSLFLGREDGIFGASATYVAGFRPYSVTAADLNGDGVPDLAAAHRYLNSVSVLLGNGDGSFGASTHYDVGDAPRSVAAADLNGDGAPDLAVANRFSANVSVLLGNGNGTFGASASYGAGNNPLSVAIGDLNGDSKPDLAVANTLSDDVTVLLGNGNGTFTAGVDYGAGDGPFSVAIEDLDGDGAPDLAVANGSSDDVSVLLGNGNGTFAACVDYGAGDAPSSVAIADLDGDGARDLAVGNGVSDDVSVLLGNGNGTFAANVDYHVGEAPSSVAVVDLNGDGAPDLAVTRRLGVSVSVLLGDGDGSFGAGDNYGAGDGPFSVAAADLNGDGAPDLAVANHNGDDISVLLNLVSAGGPDLPPAAPTGLAATPGPGEGEILASWDANSEPDLDHYYLERSTTPAFTPGTVVSLNTSATWYQDWGLVPGQTYYYRVSAVDAGSNQSGPSAVASATAPGSDPPPAAPTGLTATPGPGDGVITASWNANGEPDLAYYRLQRSTTPSFGSGTVTFTTTATSRQDSGLTPGVTYYYRVFAVDDGSNVSGPSAVASATAPGSDPPPAAPTGLTATPGPGDGVITASWNANSEPDLAYYRLQRSTTPSFGSGTVTFTTTATSRQDSGLTPGVTYYYRVMAVDDGMNVSDPSAVASATAPGSDPPPAPPTGLTATPGPGDGVITASWDANSEPDLDHYRLQRSTTPSFGSGTMTFITSATSRQDTGLTPGVTYYYRVYAVDEGSNMSDPSAVASATAPGSDPPPAPPTGLTATPGPGDGVITASWNANGEPDLAYYRLQRSTTPSFGSGTVTFTTTATSRQDSGLTPGVTYYYRVMAVDDGSNVSDPSAVASATAPGSDPPPAPPTGLTATPGPGDGEIFVSWNANSEPDLYLYRLQRSTSPSFDSGVMTFITSATSRQDSGLTPGVTYYYRVMAVDDGSNVSDPSAVASATAPGSDPPPAAPTGLTATPGPGDGVITASWDANSEPDLDHYRLQRSTTPSFGSGTMTFITSATSRQDTGLTPGVTYYYRVYAVDEGSNMSDPSSVASATAPGSGPSEVRDYAHAENTVAGTKSGDHTNTWASDDVRERLREVLSSDHPVKSYSHLEHRWTFNVTGGTAVTFFVEAYRPTNSDGDNFLFAYSTNGVNYYGLLTVASSSEQVYSATMPASTSGTVYVRVTDTDHSSGATGLDYIYIDEMFFESDAQPQPPVASFVGSPTSGYAPLSVQFTDTSTGNPTSWSWSFGDGGTSTQRNPSHTYAAAGSYTVSLTATNAEGSHTETTFGYIDVQEQPENSVSVSDIAVSRTYDGRFYRGQALVTIVNEHGTPVADATVSGTFNAPSSKTKSGTTNGSGVATVTSDKTKSPPSDWCFTVTSVTLSGHTYDPGANVVTAACESGWRGAAPGLPEARADEASLRLNRPNPFRDATEVVLVLPSETHVQLEVYNVAGRRVALLADEVMIAGPHAVRWDAADQPSGVYFCRLATERGVESRAMVLTK